MKLNVMGSAQENGILRTVIEGVILGVVITAFTTCLALWMGWIPGINWLEVASVATSYTSTFLFVKQTRWCYTFGIASTGLLVALFLSSGLMGSALVNAYLVLTLVVGLVLWNRDKETRPVKHIRLKTLPLYVLATALAYFGALWITTAMGGVMATLDSWILIGTILAQFLLDTKKLENWFVWIAVNIVSIIVYFQAGLFLLGIQFIFFLANAFYGYFSWKRTMKTGLANEKELLPV